MSNMEKIGFQLAGRTVKGFEKVLAINWQGADLADEAPSKRYADKSFYAAHMAADYATYELVICRFTAPDSRKTVFKAALRVPSKSIITDAAGNEVSPVAILDAIKAQLAVTYFDTDSEGYFYKNNSYPSAFTADTFAAVLAPYRLAPRWGKAIVMRGNPTTQQVFVDATAAEAATDMRQLALCTRLEAAGRVLMGKFSSDVPLFAFTEGELEAKPRIEVRVRDASGAFNPEPLYLNMPLALDSDTFGYNPVAYEKVELTLSRQKVFEALDNKGVYPAPAGASVTLKPAAGTVTVEFSPKSVVKTFNICFAGLANRDSERSVFDKLSFLNQGKAISLAKGCLAFEGENIIKFERRAGQPDFGKLFELSPAEDRYTIGSATLLGDTISIELKPRPRPAAVKSTKTSAAPGVQPLVSDNPSARLEVRLPLKYRKELHKLSFTLLQGTEGFDCYSYYNDVKVSKSESGYLATVTMPVMRGGSALVRIGSPIEYEIPVKLSTKGGEETEYQAVATSADRRSAWRRFCDLFSFKESEHISNASFFGRAGLLVLLVLIIFAGGVALGTAYSSEIAAFFTSTEETAPAPEPAVIPAAAPAPAEEVKAAPADSLKAVPDSVANAAVVHEAETPAEPKAEEAEK